MLFYSDLTVLNDVGHNLQRGNIDYLFLERQIIELRQLYPSLVFSVSRKDDYCYELRPEKFRSKPHKHAKKQSPQVAPLSTTAR